MSSLLVASCFAYHGLVFQLATNPSRVMAQMEQESSCNHLAKSPFASGLMQFTPSTGEWAAKTICSRLGKFKPFDPAWSIGCGITYQQHLEASTKEMYPEASECKITAIAEQRYNGGGWVLKELRRAETLDLNEASKHCNRADWACKENYSYPININKRQPRYLDLGGTVCTDGDLK